jgi:hypothetical protein
VKRKQIAIRLPLAAIAEINRIAKFADVTPTQVYNVLLATHLVAHSSAAAQSMNKEKS